MPKNTDSIEGKSSDEMKEMLMQTSVPDSGEEEREEEEATVETEETEGKEETKPEETAEAETKEEVETKETEGEKRYKIKVEGKEEELPLQKIIEYAQKGRFLERERAKDKERLEKLEKETEKKSSIFPNVPPEKLNEWFIKEFQDNPVPTFMNVLGYGVDTILSDRENKQKEEKKEERKFERQMEEENKELWKHLKPTYQDFRDMGHSRDTAFAMAKADFFQDVAQRAMETGMKKGEKKAKARQAAEIPTGEKKARGATELPAIKDVSKMTSAEMRKYLKYTRNPEW